MRESLRFFAFAVLLGATNQSIGADQKQTLCEDFAQRGAVGRSNMWLTNVQATVMSTANGCLTLLRGGTFVFACYLPRSGKEN
jgi:hypothetical protein